MFDKMLKEMRSKIREREYVMTIHADEEMNNDSLSTGKVVIITVYVP